MSAALSTACLVSPKGPPERAAAFNHQPIIVRETVQPQPDTRGVISVVCDATQVDLDFQISTIIEYDVEQKLYVRWFIDYDPDFNQVNSRPFSEQDIAGQPSGPAERDVDLSVRVPLTWLATPIREGTHLVEVVVSDAEPLAAGALPFRSFPAGGLWDTHDWVIVINEGDCQ